VLSFLKTVLDTARAMISGVLRRLPGGARLLSLWGGYLPVRGEADLGSTAAMTVIPVAPQVTPAKRRRAPASRRVARPKARAKTIASEAPSPPEEPAAKKEKKEKKERKKKKKHKKKHKKK
jgi:hypothetical protein